MSPCNLNEFFPVLSHGAMLPQRAIVARGICGLYVLEQGTLRVVPKADTCLTFIVGCFRQGLGFQVLRETP